MIHQVLKACIIISLSLMLGSTYSQDAVSIEYSPLRVLKHRSTLSFEVPNNTQEVRFRYEFQLDRTKDWVRYWNVPRLAINLSYMDFGGDVLGDAISIIPEIRFPIKRWKKYSLDLQFGTGIAYATKPFDVIQNPLNDALGSHLNNITSLKIGISRQWNPLFSNTLSIGVIHYSNGSSATPNAGLNVYGITMASTFYKKRIIEDNVIFINKRNDLEIQKWNRWSLDLGYQHGFTEVSVPGGPTFGVYDVYASGGYSWNKYLTVFLGFEYEYNAKTFFDLRNNFFTDEEASRRSKQTAVYVEQELRYGIIFNRLRVGYYLDYPSQNDKEMFYKVTSGVYFPTIRDIVQPYVGVIMKAHRTTADYIAVSGGLRVNM